MSGQATTTLYVTRHFSATPERVYDAWLDPEQARQFLFATPAGTMVKAEIDARVGGRFVFTDRRDGEDVEHVGEYLLLSPPDRLAFTFGVPKFTRDTTKVTIELVPDGADCSLTLIHEGVWEDWAEKTEQGWRMILDGLARTLSAGP